MPSPRRSFRGLASSVAAIVVFGSHGTGTQAREPSQTTRYQVVKACSLLTLAEVRKLAPWQPQLDPYATAEEEPLGAAGSSCQYPTVGIQVMSFNRGSIDALRKSGPLEAVAGVGEEAWIRNNRGNFAELVARVGPHLLTVQLNIEQGRTFESTKPALIEIGKAFAARLR